VRLAQLLDERLLDAAPAGGTSRWTPHQPVAQTPEEAAELERQFAAFLPCRTHDPELWFAEHTDEVERAKALCRACPLQSGCLAGALERSEPWGVWGGEVFVDGVVVARKRGRGRPRKTDQAAA
jgi:WhiB family transcriptional regulator, redox-sensing transcriptional regulator